MKGKEHVGTNMRVKLTCQGNLCPQRLKYPAGDFPSQRVCFHCEKTHTPIVLLIQALRKKSAICAGSHVSSRMN